MLYSLVRGTCLIQRWEDGGSANLYYGASDGRGFFMEVGIDDRRGQAVVLRRFIEAELLEKYSHGIKLPLTGSGRFISFGC